jgi:hypothetical protein
MPEPLPRLVAIWRHPVKSVGREALSEATLAAGRTLPGDRVWAVAHEASRFDAAAPAWVACPNFVLVSKAAGLQAVTASYDEPAGRVSLAHPDRPPLTVNPDLPAEAAALVAWIDPLVPPGRARPARIARVPGRGMTDTDYASVSLGNLASLRALGERMGMALSAERFRINLWVDGAAPFAEFDWIGREVGLGPVRLAVREPIRRCAATSANPETGRIDTDTPAALERWLGHRDFGVYAEVTVGGTIRPGDSLAA